MKTKRVKLPEKRVTKNTTIDAEVLAKGMQLAALEKRDYSNLLEVLIEREFERVFPAEAAKLRLRLLKGMAA